MYLSQCLILVIVLNPFQQVTVLNRFSSCQQHRQHHVSQQETNINCPHMDNYMCLNLTKTSKKSCHSTLYLSLRMSCNN